MNEIHYINADESDAYLLADYRIEFLEEYWGKQKKEDADKLRNNLVKYFSESIKNKSYICWLAKEKEKVVGIGGITLRNQPGNFKNPTGKVGYILNMYTVPSHRCKGIGMHILNKLISSAKERGYFMFELHATIEGKRLYQKNGFQLHPEPTYRKYDP